MWGKDKGTTEIINTTKDRIEMRQTFCAPMQHNYATTMITSAGQSIVLCTKCGAWTEPHY